MCRGACRYPVLLLPDDAPCAPVAARIHARRRRPFTSVALTHFAESALLFVPIFFGIFTFLFEFFADQGLALASFVLVWMGQAFHVLWCVVHHP